MHINFILVDVIHHIKVDFPPVIEVFHQTSLSMYLYDIHNASYSGFVNISIMSDSRFYMLYYVNAPINIKAHLSYSVSSVHEVKVTAKNHVSNVSDNFTIEVVRESIHKQASVAST